MQKILKRIHSGPGLFILFLVSFSVFFSLSFKTSSPNSLTNVSTHAQFLPGIELESFELDRWDTDPDMEVDDFLNDLFKPASLSSKLASFKNLINFSFIKAPLLYFLFAIPPPLF